MGRSASTWEGFSLASWSLHTFRVELFSEELPVLPYPRLPALRRIRHHILESGRPRNNLRLYMSWLQTWTLRFGSARLEPRDVPAKCIHHHRDYIFVQSCKKEMRPWGNMKPCGSPSSRISSISGSQQGPNRVTKPPSKKILSNRSLGCATTAVYI